MEGRKISFVVLAMAGLLTAGRRRYLGAVHSRRGRGNDV